MITRAKLRGRKLDKDCRRAHTTTHEYDKNDNRIFCYGLCRAGGEIVLPECIVCKAYAYNAEPPETEIADKASY